MFPEVRLKSVHLFEHKIIQRQTSKCFHSFRKPGKLKQKKNYQDYY